MNNLATELRDYAQMIEELLDVDYEGDWFITGDFPFEFGEIIDLMNRAAKVITGTEDAAAE